MVVRETVCKTILNKSSLGDYTLNCYTGCSHACVYCYARFMQRFHPHEEAWGTFVDVKINAVETLVKQLRRAAPGEVFMSSACDGWQPVEAKYRLTRRCCELLLERDFRLTILTKSDLVLRDFDIFEGKNVCLGVTFTTTDDKVRKIWEPGAAPLEKRRTVVEEAKKIGLKTSVMLGPLLPMLSDTPESLDALFAMVAALKIDKVWVDAMNPRPRVWPAVAELLRRKYPDLLIEYQKVLFNHAARAAYIEELRDRVKKAAHKHGLRAYPKTQFVSK